jgi:hypothetical protein
MEKIMEYLLEKMDWEDNDKIDVIYLIDKVKEILLNDEQAKLYIKNLIDSKLDSKMSNKYIDVALHNIKTSELSTLLRISEMEAKYKRETMSFTVLEYEKLRNVGAMYIDRCR